MLVIYSVQAPGAIVRLAIVLCVVPSFKSVHFQQDVRASSTRRLICFAQPGFSASSTIYVYDEKPHSHHAKSWPLCCISSAPAPSTITLLHCKWLKRTHKISNFWNSRIFLIFLSFKSEIAVTNIQILYILLNSRTNKIFTFTELPRSACMRSWCNLIERALLPGGGFSVGWFPNQEPQERGPSLKNNPQNWWFLSWVLSKPRTRRKRIPPEEQPHKLINFGGCSSGGSYGSGFLIWKPPSKEIPPWGLVSFDQLEIGLLAVWRRRNSYPIWAIRVSMFEHIDWWLGPFPVPLNGWGFRSSGKEIGEPTKGFYSEGNSPVLLVFFQPPRPWDN